MFKYYDKEYFTYDLYAILSKLNWDSKDPNNLWTNFKESFNSASEIHAPTRYRRVRSEYVPWINQTLIQEMNHRDYLKREQLSLDLNCSIKNIRSNEIVSII